VFCAGEDLSTKEGFIVVCDQNDYVNMDTAFVRGKAAMTINSALPYVSISSKAYDKRVFGVLSPSVEALTWADVKRNFQTDVQLARLREQGDVRVQVNSIGEGSLWVCDAEDATLATGDLVTSSDIPGYGMLQTDGRMANFTVGKVTRDCDFTAPLQPRWVVMKDVNDLTVLAEDGKPAWVQATDADGVPVVEPAYDMRWLLADGTQIESNEYTTRKAAGDVVFRAAFLGCTYHCG
jgi:hypothetical protein